MVTTRTRLPVTVLVQAELVDTDLLAVDVAMRAESAVVLRSGVAELVRTRVLSRVERNWNGLGSTVSRRSESIVSTTPLALPGPLAPGDFHRVHARLVVPSDGEGSVEGRLVQQGYVVRVRLVVMGGEDVEAADSLWPPFTPDMRETEAEQPVRSDGSADLAFEELSTHRISGGTRVTGSLTLSPSVRRSARRVRVELVMLEHVTATEGEPLQEAKDVATVFATVTVADPPAATGDGLLHLPFALTVPERLPAPALTTPEFTIRWLLRAVLDRPLRRDAQVSLVMSAATTA